MMRHKEANLRLKFVVIAFALSTYLIGRAAAQDPCAVYSVLADSIGFDRDILRSVDDSLSAVQFDDLVGRRRLNDRRKEVAVRLATRAREGASALESCITRLPAEVTSDTTLLRWFQIAKLYVDAKECSQAIPYLRLCRGHPHLHTTSLGGTGLDRYVQAYLVNCKNGSTVDVEPLTQYSGKRMYLFEENLERLVDDRPYSTDELEHLASRVYTPNKIETADSVFRALSPSGEIYIEYPFVLVAGPGGFGDHGFRSEKFPIRTEVMDHIETNLTGYLGEVAVTVVRPTIERMRRDYVLDITNTELRPVYLVGGGLHGGGLSTFNEYCLQVHRRTCGLRVAYFLPHDRSVMVWLATGGGTLVHELIHALIYDDFAGAPGWLDEGLASVFEEQNARGQPVDNYRLFFVQALLDRLRRLPPIEELVTYPREAFSQGELAGLRSALARYLALFLHERGVLSAVYRTLREAWVDTPVADRATLQTSVIANALGVATADVVVEWADWIAGRNAPKWIDDRDAITQEVMQLDLEWAN